VPSGPFCILKLLAQVKPIRRTTVLDIMRRLLQPKDRMVSTVPSSTACYITNLILITGDTDPEDVPPSQSFLRASSDLSARCRSTNRFFAYGIGIWRRLSHGALVLP